MKVTQAVALLAHPSTISVSALATAVAARKPALTRRLLVSLPLAVMSSKALKHAFPRQKPRLLSITPRQSFPSGHEAATAAFAASLVEGLGAWRAAPVAVAAVAFVGACRVKADEHRVSEVLAGVAVGLAAAGVAALIARAIDKRRARVSARS